jgi:cell division protein ZapE
MARVHDELKRHASARDPLKRIAGDWAGRADVLCFDEFFVSDIADAMLLGGLLTALFRENVVLVTTSNVHPDDLYHGGLQRARFLPTIDCIKQHCRVLELAGDRDHRLRILENAGVFQRSDAPGDDQRMEQRYERFYGGEDLDRRFQVNGRTFRARRRGLGVVWLDFHELCEKPRSALDYIEIARDFNTVLLSGLKGLDDTNANAARRFITLVDEFYDRNVKLIISSAAGIDEIYQGEKLSFEFERTRSRLIEMQGHEYLAKPHLP